MGSCLASKSQQELSATNMLQQTPNHDDHNNETIITQNTHFFIKSKLNEGYSYNDLCIRYSTTNIATQSTSEFLTPESYHPYSFKSFPDQFYSSTNPKEKSSLD